MMERIERHDGRFVLPDRARSAVFAILLLAAILLSTVFISGEELHPHHCAGEDCPICACLLQCESNLSGLIELAALTACSVALFLIFGILLESLPFSDLFRLTPVSQKIRLNH